MKNYNAYDPTPFEVTEEELKKLTPFQIDESQKPHNLELLKKKFGVALDYRVFIIPKHMKRSTNDSSKLLVITRSNTLLAKRHNNSQHMRV